LICFVIVLAIRVFFFFSSRRRHTRFSRDWSSDVCSSDLERPARSDPPRPAAGCVDQTLCAGQRSVERRPLSAAAAAPTPPFSRPAASGTGFWRRDPAIIGHKSPKKSNSVILARQRSEERRVGKECTI